MLSWVTIKSSFLYFCTAWWNDRYSFIRVRYLQLRDLYWKARKGDGALKGNLIGVNLSLHCEIMGTDQSGGWLNWRADQVLWLWLSHDKSIKDIHIKTFPKNKMELKSNADAWLILFLILNFPFLLLTYLC